MKDNILKMIEYPGEGILTKQVVSEEKHDVTLFCMAKNSSISEHTSKRSGFIYVIEGDGVFVLEGKKIKMKPGVFIFMKENATHSLSVKLNTSFLLLLR